MTIQPFPAIRPTGAARTRTRDRAMDVILHIGAHRCATTSFQHYLRMNQKRLRNRGCGSWGPRRTRAGLLSGVLPTPLTATQRNPALRAAGRIRLNLAYEEQDGLSHLLVSDENMMGTMRENLRMCDLYCGVGERTARYVAAFGERVKTVAVNVRAQDSYWASVMAFGVTRGFGVPHPETIDRIATQSSGWRAVIADIACAAPNAEIQVYPYEIFGARPDMQFGLMTGVKPPRGHARDRMNASPRLPELRAWVGENGGMPAGDGRWSPFSETQQAALRDLYEDDMMWLIAGADGLARLVTDPNNNRPEQTGPTTTKTRGRRYDQDDRRLAGAG